MQVKLLLFGEAVNIPQTAMGLGVGRVSVWMDGAGFTSASNDLGCLGYVFLNTPTVDIGTLDDEYQAIFSNLHGQVVTFEIEPSTFVRSGGHARIAMTVPVQVDGTVVDKKIEFIADDMRGISMLSNLLRFSTAMFVMERQVAYLDLLVDESEIEDIVAAAPVSDEGPIPA